MEQQIVQLTIAQFALIYILLLVVLAIMKRAKVAKIKLLIVASIRMTLQLVLVGFLLEYIFAGENPVLTVLFVLAMLVFAGQRSLAGYKKINTRFKMIIVSSLSISGLAVLSYFVIVVVREDIFNPQYTIALSGMIIGNAMTGVTLGIKTFFEAIEEQNSKIQTLLNLGASPGSILKPYVSMGVETALVPTLNSMLGMGIIFLPGMMTGQILSGISPSTAILYQIAIMIAICTSVCLSVFFSLHLGHKTLYNKRNQITI